MSAIATQAPPTGPAATATAGPRRFGVRVLAAAVVASLLVGFAVAMLTIRPAAAPDDGSAEVGFARDMIEHHTQAVTMGVAAFQRGATGEVRQLGYDIAMTQQGEIGMMHQWLRAWQVSPNAEPGEAMAWMRDDLDMALIRDGRMPGLATPDQMAALDEAGGAELDRLFLELMTYHHLGGIHMIDGVLERTDHPEVTALAELMRGAQQRELTVMRDLLAGLDSAGT